MLENYKSFEANELNAMQTSAQIVNIIQNCPLNFHSSYKFIY